MIKESEGRRLIYLTFDDGPHPEFTPFILNVLRARGIKASFFVVGSRLRIKELARIAALAASEGHTIGNHTFTHPDLSTCSEKQIREEIGNTTLQLRALGIPPTVFRPPYGNTDRRVEEIAKDLGYELVLWDNDPCDWKVPRRRQDEWVSNAVDCVDREDARVILCHDTSRRTAAHVGSLIDALSKPGLAFSNI